MLVSVRKLGSMSLYSRFGYGFLRLSSSSIFSLIQIYQQIFTRLLQFCSGLRFSEKLWVCERGTVSVSSNQSNHNQATTYPYVRKQKIVCFLSKISRTVIWDHHFSCRNTLPTYELMLSEDFISTLKILQILKVMNSKKFLFRLLDMG